ncbi:dUTPase [Sporosarcina sp. P13]|uniref:dUTP diphosphatase n=1 Tax=Sporosarcina sp. P13 TaxID=2048263 RepID=UPI000C16B3CE|nr:dUTP diphosphatase [Sporosarcina sp. P13]PIC65360.1 dUTPase [Sporosarcina sp. P13]
MNFKKLFETQKALDYHIVEEKGLEGQNLIAKKVVALQVELSELMNELPEVFKFWSNKKNDYEKALEEFVDSLHFILSIGIEKGYSVEELIVMLSGNSGVSVGQDVLKQFKYLNGAVSDFSFDGTKYSYEELLLYFINLGESLGFTTDQIEAAYYAKNEVNHERQISGY